MTEDRNDTGREEGGEPPAGGKGDLPLPQELLDIIVCPLGKAPVRLEGERLVCTRCGLAFAIEDGIPNMLVEEAQLPPGVRTVDELPCRRVAGPEI